MSLCARIPVLLAVPALMLLCMSCIEVEDRLHIAADGSSTVELLVRPQMDLQPLVQLRSQRADVIGAAPAAWYPPLDVADAQRLLPGASVEASKDGGLRVQAAFDDPQALLASPYASVHQLQLRVDAENDLLEVQGLDGSGVFLAATDDALHGLEADALQEQRHRWHLRWELRLPGPSGQHEDDRRAWSVAPAGTAPQRKDLVQTRRAACALPATWPDVDVQPLRPALQRYEAVEDRNASGGTDAVGLQVELLALRQQTAYLYTDTWAQNELYCYLHASLPQEQAPAQWPEQPSLEVTDDTGLILSDKARPVSWMSRHLQMQPQPGRAQHLYVVRLAAPAADATTLTRLRGSLPVAGPGSLQRQRPIATRIPAVAFTETAGLPLDLQWVDGADTGAQLVQIRRMEGLVLLRFRLDEEMPHLLDLLAYGADGRLWPGCYLGRRGTGAMLLLWGAPAEDLRLVAVHAAGSSAVQAFDLGPVALQGTVAADARPDATGPAAPGTDTADAPEDMP
ncbi:MAG: hypothetical protein ACOCXJ_01115 [Planctomycetota bacterium]